MQGTWSEKKQSSERKDVKTRYFYGVKDDAESSMKRYKARLVA